MTPAEAQRKISEIVSSVEMIVKGKTEAVRMAIVTLLCRGHLLIEDVPGVGKTVLAHSLAQSLDCSFRRIQFTSDLLPSDILGVNIMFFCHDSQSALAGATLYSYNVSVFVIIIYLELESQGNF